MSPWRKLIKALASLKLAVFVLLLIAILTAIGTFVESKYDALAAQKWVYHSLWMEIVLGLLAVNLTAVILDRYPWQPKHSSFISAHIGILILMLGQWISTEYGIDGHVRVGVGEKNRFAMLGNRTDLILYTSFDGSSYTKLFDQEVDFFLKPPTESKALEIPVEGDVLRLTAYKPYVVPNRKVVESELPVAGSGLRFQIHNDRVNVVEWLVQRNPKISAEHNFGPAQVILGEIPPAGLGLNQLYLKPEGDKLKYTLFIKDSFKPKMEGFLKEGDSFETPWMGLVFRALRYLPRAQETWELKDKETPTPLTTSAAQVEFQGKKHWILLNDTLKLFTNKSVYVLTYAHRRVDLGFPIELLRFNMDRYQGTNRAASYESRVKVPDLGETLISMNEPLKYNGFTIYQASFEEDPSGGPPTASIFSVNKDPGRVFKYLGSLITCLGVVLLFYFRRKRKKALE